MDTVTKVQILDETVCFSNSANILGKSMNSIILPPAMGRIVGQTRLFWYGNRPRKRKTLNSDLLNSAQKIDLITSCSCGGVSKYIPFPLCTLLKSFLSLGGYIKVKYYLLDPMGLLPGRSCSLAKNEQGLGFLLGI